MRAAASIASNIGVQEAMASEGLMNVPIQLGNGYNEAKISKVKSAFESETQLRHLPGAYVEACKQPLGTCHGLRSLLCCFRLRFMHETAP